MDAYIENPDPEFEKKNEEILDKPINEYEVILQEKLASIFWIESQNDLGGNIRIKGGGYYKWNYKFAKESCYFWCCKVSLYALYRAVSKYLTDWINVLYVVS